MGMSSWIMDLEDKYWDTVATIVSESETFQEAAFQLKPGDVSAPILTDFGYHLVFVKNKRDERNCSYYW